MIFGAEIWHIVYFGMMISNISRDTSHTHCTSLDSPESRFELFLLVFPPFYFVKEKKTIHKHICARHHVFNREIITLRTFRSHFLVVIRLKARLGSHLHFWNRKRPKVLISFVQFGEMFASHRLVTFYQAKANII